MKNDAPRDNPGVIAPPPLIYIVPLLISLLLHIRFPLRFLPRRVAPVLGGSLLGVSATLVISAIRIMRSAGTNVDPRLPATTVVVEGPFEFTRNPLYLALTLFYTGIAALVNTLWAVLLLPVILLIMRRGVIDREERYLEHTFGEQYVRYKERVRRWL